MVTPPEQRRPVVRLIVLAIVIGVAVFALIASLVWQPLASSLRLDPAPARVLATNVKPSAGAARAP